MKLDLVKRAKTDTPNILALMCDRLVTRKWELLRIGEQGTQSQEDSELARDAVIYVVGLIAQTEAGAKP